MTYEHELMHSGVKAEFDAFQKWCHSVMAVKDHDALMARSAFNGGYLAGSEAAGKALDEAESLRDKLWRTVLWRDHFRYAMEDAAKALRLNEYHRASKRLEEELERWGAGSPVADLSTEAKHE